ncbi:MAG: hypothetical protein KatS3mg059_1349 [Thermomicrobiales bacterium]|nr:MAG: hypothetical protein KatS3mg059_1349 [Thermomicrobiales bacterium]
MFIRQRAGLEPRATLDEIARRAFALAITGRAPIALAHRRVEHHQHRCRMRDAGEPGSPDLSHQAALVCWP